MVENFDKDSLWYKDAIIYEVHVKSFHDYNADGVGDFQGLMEKLDYLKDLGITSIWLLPFYPSPFKDDGYDITDYVNIHPDFGNLNIFRKFLKEAHKRNIRVITEMVLNHTSNQHPWFHRARISKPNSVWRNFYIWSDNQEKYREARIIFKDFETSNWAWDSVAKAYYWHRFYSHQPDLNYDNPLVQKTMIRVIDFWFNLGVDGIRLDAVPYLYEREGTNCENLPETHVFLKKLRAHVENKFQNKMLLAEANQWPEDAAGYFGNGDECHMAYHFPLMPRMFMAVEMEDRFPIIDILGQTPQIPASCQWALFLRNHDELTLEMVTDEERDYMYKVFVRDPRAKINSGIRRRLATLLDDDYRKIKLMFLLLFTLPGTPVIYYGDEIGMGDNYYLGDRNGVRTPMQWSPNLNAGFSSTNPQELYLPVVIDPQYHYEAVNVSNQERDPSSLLWWMKQTIAIRKRSRALARGDIKILLPGNSKVMAFIRHFQDETILVAANLSKYSQQAELDLKEYAGFIPEEVQSRNRFSAIKGSPYMLTFGPYDYYIFQLLPEAPLVCVGSEGIMPVISDRSWVRLLDEITKENIEDILPAYLKCSGWFGGIGRVVQRAKIEDFITIGNFISYLLIVKIEYTEGLPDLYLLPLSFASGEKAAKIAEKYPQSMIIMLKVGDGEGVIYDGVFDNELRETLLTMILHKRASKNHNGKLIFYRRKSSRKYSETGRSSELIKSDPGVVNIQFKDELFLKLFRRLEKGNHEVEITKVLTAKGFANIPPYEGGIEYIQNNNDKLAIGMLQRYVPNEGDALKYTSDEVVRYFERILSRKLQAQQPPKDPEWLINIDVESIPPIIQDLLGGLQIEMAQLLGKRTGEMHLALASSNDPDFAPVPFSAIHQKSLYQSMRISATRTIQSLARTQNNLPDAVQSYIPTFLDSEKEILNHLRRVMKQRLSGAMMRIHGDYRLGQLLYSGKDFFIFGFDGRPEYSLEERKIKRSPVLDLASMVISFHLASSAALFKYGMNRKEDLPMLVPWQELWAKYISGLFISAYRKTIGNASFMPRDLSEFEILLNAVLLDRAIYELGDSLDEPSSAEIPLKVVIYLLKSMRNNKT